MLVLDQDLNLNLQPIGGLLLNMKTFWTYYFFLLFSNWVSSEKGEREYKIAFLSGNLTELIWLRPAK